jgi:dihydroneopterin aldolase
MDKILLRGVELQCTLGVPDEERRAPQGIAVDVDLFFDYGEAARNDDFSKTVDYAAVREVLERVAGEREYKLVETLADRMANAVLVAFRIEEIMVRVWKPSALAAFGVDNTAIELRRKRI